MNTTNKGHCWDLWVKQTYQPSGRDPLIGSFFIFFQNELALLIPCWNHELSIHRSFGNLLYANSTRRELLLLCATTMLWPRLNSKGACHNLPLASSWVVTPDSFFSILRYPRSGNGHRSSFISAFRAWPSARINASSSRYYPCSSWFLHSRPGAPNSWALTFLTSELTRSLDLYHLSSSNGWLRFSHDFTTRKEKGLPFLTFIVRIPDMHDLATRFLLLTDDSDSFVVSRLLLWGLLSHGL